MDFSMEWKARRWILIIWLQSKSRIRILTWGFRPTRSSETFIKPGFGTDRVNISAPCKNIDCKLSIPMKSYWICSPRTRLPTVRTSNRNIKQKKNSETQNSCEIFQTWRRHVGVTVFLIPDSPKNHNKTLQNKEAISTVVLCHSSLTCRLLHIFAFSMCYWCD